MHHLVTVDSYEIDLIKTRLHFEVGKAANQEAAKGLNMSSVAKKIWAEGAASKMMGSGGLGGFFAFYRGLDQLLPEAAFKVSSSTLIHP